MSEEFGIRDVRPGDNAAVREIVFSTLHEFGLTPEEHGADADLADTGTHYAAAGGVFRVVTESDGAVVGCGGLYPLDNETIEIRKMYLSRAVRGRGLGRRLLEDLLATARRLGYTAVELETASMLKAAIEMYLRSGFVEIPRQPAVRRCDRVFRLELDGLS